MMRALKISITIMTTLIFVGLGLLIYKLNAGTSFKSDTQADIMYIPEHVQIINAFSQGKDIGFLVRENGEEKILFFTGEEKMSSRTIKIARTIKNKEN